MKPGTGDRLSLQVAIQGLFAYTVACVFWASFTLNLDFGGG